MKKLLVLLTVALLMVFALTACSSDSSDDKGAKGSKETEKEDVCSHEFDEDSWQVERTSTCTETGVEFNTCVLCKERVEKKIEKLAHSVEDYTTTKYPSCTEEGLMVGLCSSCNSEVEEKIEKEAHTAGEVIVNLDGYQYTYCSVCEGEMEKVEAPEHLESEFKVDESGYYCIEETRYYYEPETQIVQGYGVNVIKNDFNATVCEIDTEDEKFVGYGNGYYISEIGDVMYLKTVDGKEITNTDKLGVALFEDNYADEFLASGYVVVYSVADLGAGTYNMGILNVDGTWAINPFDNPIDTVTDPELILYAQPAGEGNAVIGSLIYNRSMNKLFEINLDGLESGEKYGIMVDMKFNNGNSVCYHERGNSIFVLKDDGTVTKVYRFEEGLEEYSEESEDYYMAEDGTVFFMAKLNDKIVLANSKGEVVKDFAAAYGVNVIDATCNGDGRWVLEIEEDEDHSAYTVVDTTGEFAFEPITVEYMGECIIYDDNVPLHEDLNGTVMVIDGKTGEVIYSDYFEYDDFQINKGIFYKTTYPTEEYFIPGESEE